MNSSTQEISPLRQRMLDDLRMRKLGPKMKNTQRRSKDNPKTRPVRSELSALRVRRHAY